MARRVPLPRLTRRQRTSRWQRERRQQAVIVSTFTAVLVFVLGLAAWAASDRYYQDNLVAVATIQGDGIPKRELESQLQYELIAIYQRYGVPAGFENDPQLDQLKVAQREVALGDVVQRHILDRAAAETGFVVPAARIDEQYEIEFGEYRVRHVLISRDSGIADPDAADAYAKMRAQAVADQLRTDPKNDELWKSVAADNSDDPGSNDAGGELGWASSGSYVREFEDAIRTLAIGDVSGPVRTSFGYHVIQVEEKRAPSDNEVVQKYLSYGYSAADLKDQVRYQLLRREFERRQLESEPSGTAEQVHIAKIVVNIPPLTTGNFEDFTKALDKQQAVKTALDAGQDFAEVAKANSDDAETAPNGGDAGWIVRGMIADEGAEDLVFGTAVGATTAPISTVSQWTIYKVLEKDPARAITEAQRATQQETAYDYWIAKQKKAYDVHVLIGSAAY